MRNPNVKIHFFCNNQHLYSQSTYHVPRVGDELRFLGEKFYAVKRIVWAYDETNIDSDRVNIEIVKVN